MLGYPSEEDLEFINNETSLNYIKKLPKTGKKMKWEEKIPGINHLAVDLLNKLLSFNPNKRISVEEAIQHPYFSNFAELGIPRKAEE